MKRTKELERTAHHEAGHVVAAWRMGERSRAVSIIPDEDNRYLGYHQPAHYSKPYYNPSPRVQRRLENIALACLAGQAAERRFDPRGYRHHSATRDDELAIDLLWHMSETIEEVKAYFQLVQARANFVVETHWRTIEHFAEALLERGTLMREEIRETLIGSYHRAIEEANMWPPEGVEHFGPTSTVRRNRKKLRIVEMSKHPNNEAQETRTTGVS